MKYGLLKSSALNSGDEIQSVIIEPFLPRVDTYLDGCYLKDIKSDQRIKLIIHGCFNTKPKNWPPSPLIEPLLISLHIGEYVRKEFISRESIEYLKRHEPIGCRDTFTLELLRREGVKAYFSGCVTLMLKPREKGRTDEIILTDLDRGILRYIPPQVLTRATILHHGRGLPLESIASRLYEYSPHFHKAIKATRIHLALGGIQQGLVRLIESEARRKQRFGMASDLLERYAQAKLVITSRLHGALPCLALGTPVVFVHRNLDDTRFPGLLDYLRAYSAEEFQHRVKDINFETPEPNPKSINGLRDSLIRTCEKFIGGD